MLIQPLRRKCALPVVALGACLSLAWPLACTAQTAGNAEKIRANAARLDEARKLFNDSSGSVRLAALDEYLRSNDAALRELAFEEGFASADPKMRTLALRARLAASKTLTVELLNTKKLPEGEWTKFLQAIHFPGGRVVFQNLSLDEKTGEITAYGGKGRLAGQELSMNVGYYVLLMRLGNDAVLEGTVSYGNNVGTGRIKLQ